MSATSVLIVDDVPGMRQAVAELLDSLDDFHVVGTAENGARAVTLSEELRPNLVLMDIKMPEMDGIEATKIIRHRLPNTTVVAYTAYEDAGLVREMIAAGAKGYVLKGSDSDELLDALAGAVQGQGAVSGAVTRPLLDDLERLYQEERQKADSLAGLVDHLQKVATTDSLTGLFNHRHFHERLEEEVARAERHRQTLGLIALDIDDFKSVNDNYGHAKGDEVLQQIAKVVGDRLDGGGLAFRVGGDEFSIIVSSTGTGDALAIAEALRAAIEGEQFDLLDRLTVSVGLAVYPENAAEKNELARAADFAMYRSKGDGKNRTTLYDPSLEAPPRQQRRAREREEYMNAVLAVAAAIGARSQAIYQHCQNVSRCAVAIAQHLGLSQTQIEVVRIGGLLHDAGKIGVPDEVLSKPGALNEEEWTMIHGHTNKGRSILGYGIPKPVVDTVMYHHEQPDGEGYPEGLKGDEIPFSARIVRVADVFDSLTADQPYRRAFTLQEALAKLNEGRGTKFDEDAVDALVALVEEQWQPKAA